MANNGQAVWLAAGLRTPFVAVDGPFAHRDSLGLSVGLFMFSVCFLPKTLNSAFPSFSIPLTQPSMMAGVAAISAISSISPVEKVSLRVG